MPEPTLDDLKRAIVKAETECHHDKLQAWDIPGASKDCPDCHGTGRVSRFPELQAECPQLHGYVKGKRHMNNPRLCYLCHGLSYVPLEGGWEGLATWIRVLGDALLDLPPLAELEEYHYCVAKGDILGAFKAVVEVLGIEVTT